MGAAKPNGQMRNSGSGAVRLTLTSLLAAFALILGYLETMIPIPVPIPGVKLGLSNVAVILALYIVGTRCACAVATVKVAASALLFGSPVMFAYSAAGTFLALLGMLALYRVRGVGVVAVSMVAAVLHNIGQLVVAAFMLSSAAVFISLPPLMLAACITGALTGAVAAAVLPAIASPWETDAARVHACVQAMVATPQGKQLLEAITPGKIVALVGPNGAGKSTFAKQLPNLLAPRRVCIAFQNPDDQIVAAVVRDDVAFGLENEGVEPIAMECKVDYALDQVGLFNRGFDAVQSLSGGQRQQEALAGLMVLMPDVLVLDETTAMMDMHARCAFWENIASLAVSGCAVVLVTQRKEEALKADTIALLRGGKIERVGSADILEEEPWLFGV